MANTNCYDRDCDFEIKEEEETLFVSDFILTAGAVVLTVLLLAAMLLNTALGNNITNSLL